MSKAIPRIDPYSVRGWCPTGMRAMQTGDGLLIRLNPRGRSLSPDDLTAIADVAERHGNGLIDLTRRANVQLRGLTEPSLPVVWQELTRVGLLDVEPANILVGPLTGIDPQELIDAGALAIELQATIAGNPVLRALPAKFSFVVDGGSSLSLDDEPADVRLRALTVAGETAIALAIDRVDGPEYLGACAPNEAAAAGATLAERYVELRPHARARMRDLSDEAVQRLMAFSDGHLRKIDSTPAKSAHNRPLGPVHIDGKLVAAVGLTAAFGRLAAKDLRILAGLARETSISGFRVSPWRSLYAETADPSAAGDLTQQACSAGFLIDPDDPLLAIDACPGAPACTSASVDTRTVADSLAPMLKELGIRTCHVSGCSKGCARSAPADLTLVGAGGSLAVVHHGTTRSTPSRYVHPGDLATRPHLLDPA